MYADSLKVSETYKNMPKFIQINLTNNREEIPLSTTYTVNNKETGMKFVDNFIIYEINLQKAKEAWYNNPSGKRLLALIDCNEEELENAIGDGFVERIKKEVKELNKDVKFVNFLTDEEEEGLYTNSIKQESYDDGYEEGIEQKTIEIAKNMLKTNIDINVISKVTGLSVEAINKLK